MKTVSFRWTRAAAAAVLVPLAMVACEQASAPVLPPAEPPALPTEPGIHPLLVVAAQTQDSATIELYLRRVQVPDAVASFQGVLEYDTSHLALARVSFGPGAAGDFNEVAPGRVRLATASAHGLGDGPVATLTFARSAAIDGTAFRIDVEELVAQQAFANLTSRVVSRPHPFFSAQPLPELPETTP